VQEETNYLRHIISQWREITLQWDPTVVQSFDPESISMLQSRAPLLSVQDHDYIVRKFERGKILTQLTDHRLREAVENKVCRQGPIMTLATFAKDLRVVTTRVHDPLTAVLGTMRRPRNDRPLNDRPRNDTLRKKVSKIFEEEFEALLQLYELNVPLTISKAAFVEICYQHFFLDALRARRSKSSINRDELSQLAVSEFNRLQRDGIVPGWSNVNGNDGDIVIATSDGTLQTDSGWQDIEVERRHGNLLFKAATAASLLYSDRIHEEHPYGSPISQAFMAKHVARIFLFGTTLSPEAFPVPPRSPRLSLNPVDELLNRLPFRNRDSASIHTLDNYDILSLSSYMPTEVDTQSVLRRRPYRQMAIASSKAASIVDWEISPVELENASEGVRKRSRAIFRENTPEDRESGHLSTRKKIRRSLDSPHASPPRSVEHWVSYQRSSVPQQGYQVASIAPSIVEENSPGEVLWFGTRKTQSSAMVQKSPNARSMNSPSMYSPDRRSLVSQVRSPEYGHSSGPAEAYRNLLRDHNPFLDSRAPSAQHAEVKHMAAHELNHIPFEYDRIHGGEPKKMGSRYIVYRSSQRPNMSYCALSDAQSTEAFVKRQKSIDPRSKFTYLLDGVTREFADNYEQLQLAIEKYNLDTVYVDSVLLGSTDSTTTLA
jgi:hypothetical protein